MIIICSIAAAVNGMDLVSINGANIFFPTQFGIDKGGRDTWLVGLVNSAPYITCALFSVWLNEPLNRWIGRRGVLFLSGCVCFTASIWAACTNTWVSYPYPGRRIPIPFPPALIHCKVASSNSTSLVRSWDWTKECNPQCVCRRSCSCKYQRRFDNVLANMGCVSVTCSKLVWIQTKHCFLYRFGIMMGTACNIAFYKVPDASGIEGLNWRLMVGVAGVPALILLFQVYTNPESPRWLMLKGRYNKAFQSLRILRGSDVQAARDLFYIHLMLEEEAESETHQSATKFVRMFTARRNLNAVIGSSIVMFAQQFCGINIISYYSTTIFTETGASQVHSLLASWGFGMLNFLFALPAVHMIDRFGRRSLLLWTFPFMTLFLLVAAGGFYVEDSTSKLAVVALGIYFYVVFYSPGEGPVPFVYSAEAFPLAIRDLGMSWAVFICWFFNALIGLTFPSIIDSFTAPGAFFWYAGWNALLYVIIYFFVPETKSLTLGKYFPHRRSGVS